MKFKKIIAAVCAAAMTVSAVALTPLFTSAEEIVYATTNNIAAKSVTVEYELTSTSANELEYMYSQAEVIVKTWNNEANAGDWIKYGMGGSAQEQWFANWVATYTGTKLEGTFTANLTEYDILDELCIIYNVGNYYEMQLGVIKAYSGFDATGDVVWEYDPNNVPDVDIDFDDTEIIWEGDPVSLGEWTNSVEIDSAKLSGVKDGSQIKISFTIDDPAQAQLSVKSKADGWPPLSYFNELDPQYGVASITSGTDYTFALNSEDVTNLVASGMAVAGKYLTITKIEIVTAGGSTGESGDNDDDDDETIIPPADEPETPKVVNELKYDCLVPSVFGNVTTPTSTAIAAIKDLEDGDEYEYTLTKSYPIIKKQVFQKIMGKDITLVVHYLDMTWEINGKEITKPHPVNFRALYEEAKAAEEAAE